MYLILLIKVWNKCLINTWFNSLYKLHFEYQKSCFSVGFSCFLINHDTQMPLPKVSNFYARKCSLSTESGLSCIMVTSMYVSFPLLQCKPLEDRFLTFIFMSLCWFWVCLPSGPFLISRLGDSRGRGLMSAACNSLFPHQPPPAGFH